MWKITAILIAGIISFSAAAAASVQIVFFVETGCPECARVRDFLENRINPNYDVIVHEYEIHTGDNAARMLRLADIYGADGIRREGTRAVWIGEHAI